MHWLGQLHRIVLRVNDSGLEMVDCEYFRSQLVEVATWGDLGGSRRHEDVLIVRKHTLESGLTNKAKCSSL